MLIWVRRGFLSHRLLVSVDIWVMANTPEWAEKMWETGMSNTNGFHKINYEFIGLVWLRAMCS